MKKSEVNLYYIKSNFEKIIYRLCKKLHFNGFKIYLNLKNEAELKKIDSFFWTFEKTSFLPHLTYADEKDYGINPIFLNSEYKSAHDSQISKYDIIISSPEAKLKKLEPSKKYFFFSNSMDKTEYLNIKKKFEVKGFPVKTFIEYSNLKWEKV